MCTPWFETSCTWRQRSAAWTSAHWRRHGFRLVHGTGPTRAASRNAAASAATGANVFVFADADMYVSKEQVDFMATVAAQTNSFVGGFTRYWRQFKSAEPWERKGEPWDLPLPGGILAVSRQCWETVGGYDERFEGWGGEDRSFEWACITLCGPSERICGEAFHAYHPMAREVEGWQERNYDLTQRYRKAAGDPGAMRSLLAEPGGPLS